MLLHPNSKPEYSVTSVTNRELISSLGHWQQTKRCHLTDTERLLFRERNLIVTSQSQIVLFFFLIMTFKGGRGGRYF